MAGKGSRDRCGDLGRRRNNYDKIRFGTRKPEASETGKPDMQEDKETSKDPTTGGTGER